MVMVYEEDNGYLWDENGTPFTRDEILEKPMETITAREFLENSYDISFMTSQEVETIVTAMNLYAKGKCREQRKLCFDGWQGMPEWESDSVTERIDRAKTAILDAPEPIFDLPEII